MDKKTQRELGLSDIEAKQVDRGVEIANRMDATIGELLEDGYAPALVAISLIGCMVRMAGLTGCEPMLFRILQLNTQFIEIYDHWQAQHGMEPSPDQWRELDERNKAEES